jgi:BirA family biotin operon repressor/biotin-[acetyl-CoA-carboxylase] ligase
LISHTIDKSNAASTDRLIAAGLREALGQCIIGREIIVFEEATSTNDAVLHQTTSSTPQGLVIFAERQTAGRGQRSNRWESAAYKGLWFSILLRPKIALAESRRLAAWAIKAIAQTISEGLALVATIKPPNDVYIDGRKAAGVLVEMRAQEKAPHFAIVGIGINVNQSTEDFPKQLSARAISLAMVLHRQVDRQELAIALLRKLDSTYCDLFGS